MRVAMNRAITRNVSPVALEDPNHESWRDDKAGDKILAPVFRSFVEFTGFKAGLVRKSDYHQLVDFIPKDEIPGEVREVLDQIHHRAKRAEPGP